LHQHPAQLEDEPTIVESSAYIASKHFKNSTLIQMDENGDYQIVHGSKLHEIKADNIKILFVGHGDEEFKKSGDVNLVFT
jgi:hypothetical protein